MTRTAILVKELAMSDKRMLILPAELVNKIDANRGDMSQADFIDFLIENHFKGGNRTDSVAREEMDALKKELTALMSREKKLATKDELEAFHEDTKKLLKSFVDFFVGYGLELGDKSQSIDFRDITGKLKELDKTSPSEAEGREVKIKWK
jgi:hypothetical protein